MKNTLPTLAMLLLSSTLFAQVGIGTQSPHSSSILDLTSSDKGFLPPRLASDAEVQTPIAEGLVIYDESDDCLNVYSEDGWINLCESSSGGNGNGNGNASSIFYAWEAQVRFSQVSTPLEVNNNNETTVGVSVDGNAYAWGNDEDAVIQNFDASAGLAETSDVTGTIDFLPTPWRISDTRFDGQVKKFITFEGKYLILTNNGELYVFGNNEYDFVDPNFSESFKYIKPRLKASPVANETFSDIQISNERVTVVMSDGSAHFWGEDFDSVLSGSNTWREIAHPVSAGAGFEYTQIMDSNNTNERTLFLKGNDNKIYVASSQADLRGSNGTASGTRSLENGSHIYELQFPAGAGEIMKIQSSGTTAVAFDNQGNTYGWGRYAASASSPASSPYTALNFVVDASQSPVITADGFYAHILDPVLLDLPMGETSFVSFSKQTLGNISGSFFVGASGKTYFIGDSTDSSVESANLFSNGATSLNYVESISAAHIDVVEVSHEKGYVGLLDRNGAWYYFGEHDIVNIGGFNTPLLNSSNLSTTANFNTPLAQPLQQGILDTSNLRPHQP